MTRRSRLSGLGCLFPVAEAEAGASVGAEPGPAVGELASSGQPADEVGVDRGVGLDLPADEGAVSRTSFGRQSAAILER